MEELVIKIDWWEALITMGGIAGSIITVAWVMSGRLTRVETNVKWLMESFKDMRDDIKVANDNERIDALAYESPVTLTKVGKTLLEKSGLKQYIDTNRNALMEDLGVTSTYSAYELQERIFDLFDEEEFPTEIDQQIKQTAYEEGVGTEILRRIGAVYFRDICLSEFGKNIDDIDGNT